MAIPFTDSTYTIDQADSTLVTEGDQSTFLDITDVFDDSVEPTLWVVGNECSEGVPDLSQDSRQATYSQSTPNSKESTPKALRKISDSSVAPSSLNAVSVVISSETLKAEKCPGIIFVSKIWPFFT